MSCTHWTLRKTLIVVAILAGAAGLLAPMNFKPGGSDWFPVIPSGLDESRRVYSATGFSVVRPPGWEITTDDGPDGGKFRLWRQGPNRPPAQIFIAWSRDEPTEIIEGREIVLRDGPAWMTSERQAPSWFYMGHERVQAEARAMHGAFDAKIVARRGVYWVEFHYSFLGDQSAIPATMWEHLESFACPGEGTNSAG